MLSEIVGEMGFSEAFYFIVTGRKPDAMQLKVFDASMVILMETFCFTLSPVPFLELAISATLEVNFPLQMSDTSISTLQNLLQSLLARHFQTAGW